MDSNANDVDTNGSQKIRRMHLECVPNAKARTGTSPENLPVNKHQSRGYDIRLNLFRIFRPSDGRAERW
jgi:hypothetical protein